MTKLTYYVAASIDGFIADSNGDVSWLDMINLEENDHGFNDFYDGIDSLIMGRATYEQILDFGDWPYPGKPCWVMTSQDIGAEYDEVTVTAQAPDKVLQTIQQQGHSRTWLVGGGKLASAFHDDGLIDEYFISMIPCILGKGIPLLAEGARYCSLNLIESTGHDSGVVQLRYQR